MLFSLLSSFSARIIHLHPSPPQRVCSPFHFFSLSQPPWCRAPTHRGTEDIRTKDHCSRRTRIPSVSSVTISRTDALEMSAEMETDAWFQGPFQDAELQCPNSRCLAFCPNVINISCPSEQSQPTLKSHIHLLEHGWEFLSLYSSELSTVFWD